ncbi:flagellin [Thiomicrospira aerophila AL3]|uniref:Flagellin n=1 Tax=Thiomicrospira aerophila AL3 TaxID=717772 RepID=W0DWC6_9GAMM|nr:flagellin [Thiomicrospira aerophila]AHF01583.1 flagellin [Thiomicrospira aerophila AL3]
MSMTINTNTGAINATRLLDNTSRDQMTSMERLTSGLRINRAADDAAGLAVVTGMTTQIRGLDQAVRNSNDAIGLVQTADGAANEITDMLQRMRELGLQSMTGTFSADNRTQMDKEYQQLTEEIDRIASTTKFNNNSLMDGTNATFTIQVGWETASGNQLEIQMTNLGTSAIGRLSGSALALSIGSTGITTVASASAAIGAIDGALETINTFRSDLGAAQNRLTYTVSNLSNVSENLQGARSVIQDANFAQESANLARTQVLQQAGMSMLAQANQQSLNVLSLLR